MYSACLRAVPVIKRVFVVIFSTVDLDRLGKIESVVTFPSSEGATTDISITFANLARRQLAAGSTLFSHDMSFFGGASCAESIRRRGAVGKQKLARFPCFGTESTYPRREGAKRPGLFSDRLLGQLRLPIPFPQRLKGQSAPTHRTQFVSPPRNRGAGRPPQRREMSRTCD